MTIRVGLIGAGYISDWHGNALKATPGVAVAAVCYTSRSAAEALAGKYGVPAFTSVAEMIESGSCQAAHIMTPPHIHAQIAKECLAGGLDVLIEKPIAETSNDVAEIAAAAKEHGRVAHVGHNFLGLPSYERLRDAVKSGAYGRVSSVDLTWALPLPPLRSGPYGIWMLRQPRNLVLEIGPHLIAPIVDLFGTPEVLSVQTFKPVTLAGGDVAPQSIRVIAQAGGVDIAITLSLVETSDDRSMVVRGSTARARLDLAQDTLIVDRDNTSEVIVNPAQRQLGLAGRHLREGARNFFKQAISLNQKTPYGLSFQGMNKAVYQALANGAEPDPRFSIESGLSVMKTVEAIADAMPNKGVFKRAEPKPFGGRPDVMVIGGTGFIGRVLTRRLVADGHKVRVVSRGRHSPFTDISEHVETHAVSMHDKAGLVAAMQGIDTIYNLSKYVGANWQDCLNNEVAPLMNVTDAMLEAGVRKMVYTGTIASYNMSDPGQTITEDTDFGPMENRNLYARSKAECEARLLERHAKDGADITIARPGIVVGEGGPLQHWGIGRWHGAGAVRIWGPGRNILPFVLVEDVADGLIRMAKKDTAGQSFNLIGEPMMTARDYFKAINDELGADIQVRPGVLNVLWVSDAAKWALKRYALGKRDAVRANRDDWRGRAHLSPFDNTQPKEVLGWAPEADQDAFVKAAVTNANLFGF